MSSAAPPLRDLDTRDVLRAMGITAIVANHAFAASLHGGLNLLLLISGIAFAQLVFGGEDRTGLANRAARFVRPLVTWSVVFCLFWFAVFGRFEPAEILMLSNWITTERVSKFPIWYTQVLLQIVVVLCVLLPLSGALQRVREAPVTHAVRWLAATVAVAVVAQVLVDTDHLADKLPHLHAWNFVLGWLFWAVLYAREPGDRDRVALTALCVPLMLLMFVGLDAPGGGSRAWVAIPAVLLLIWAPRLRLPRRAAHPLLLICQSVLFIFFLHYPFILALRDLAGDVVPETALDVMQFAAGIVGPVIVWAFVTAGHRVLVRAGAARSGGARRQHRLGAALPVLVPLKK